MFHGCHTFSTYIPAISANIPDAINSVPIIMLNNIMGTTSLHETCLHVLQVMLELHPLKFHEATFRTVDISMIQSPVGETMSSPVLRSDCSSSKSTTSKGL